MLDYTKAALRKTLDDFKKVDYVRNIITQLLYIGYLVYAVCTKVGFIWVDVALLALSVAYFVFFMVMTEGKPLQPPKRGHKFGKKLFKRCKQLLKLFNLGVMIYGVYFTTERVSPFAVILSVLMIVLWLLQIIFEVLIRILTSRAKLIIEGLEADYESIVKPVKSVGNFFKKIAGKEVEPPKEKSKNRVWLDQKVEENRAEKKEKKRQEKLDKKQAKKAAKSEKKRAQKDAKNTVFLSPVKEEAVIPEQNELPPPLELVDEPPLLLSEPNTPPSKKEMKKAQKAAKKQEKQKDK